MKTTTRQCIAALLMATALAGCGMIPAQNQGRMRAASYTQPSPSEAWAAIMELDRASVARGELPPEVIRYDLQIAQMIPEGEAIIAAKDQARARVWSEKLNTIQVARNDIMAKRLAREMAKNNNTVPAWSNATPDPCLSPMGRNICASKSAPQDRVNYTVGPSGMGATVGGISVGPGGLGGVIGGQ